MFIIILFCSSCAQQPEPHSWWHSHYHPKLPLHVQHAVPLVGFLLGTDMWRILAHSLLSTLGSTLLLVSINHGFKPLSKNRFMYSTSTRNNKWYPTICSGDEASQWRVVLGSTWGNSGGIPHPVSQLVLHPQYDRVTLDHDIAIVRLSRPAVYSDIVQPASIAGANYNLADGTVVEVIGWGAIWVIFSYLTTYRYNTQT